MRSGRFGFTVLGSGAILSGRDRQPPGYLLHDPVAGRPLLLDPGPGAFARLAGLGVAPRSLDRVVLSHLHVDHHLDLLALLFARHNPELRAAGLPRLHVLGPPGTRGVVAGWEELYGRSVADPDLEVRELAPGEHALEHLVLRAAPAAHGASALCLRFELPGQPPLVYSGDTGPTPALAELARGAHVLLCECSLPDDRPDPCHLTPSQAGAIAEEARVRHLVLTHFYPAVADGDPAAAARRVFGGRVHVARDLETYEL